jgi:uncharacterized protein (DUF885 family)
LGLGLIVLAITTAAAQNKPDAAAATTKLADDFVSANLERYPEQGTFSGAPDARNQGVFDNTLEARRAWDKRVDAFQAAFKAIDKKALAGRPELLTYGYIDQAIGSEIERRVVAHQAAVAGGTLRHRGNPNAGACDAPVFVEE